ncbi:homoserine kinase [Nibricoccus aquaticus]|uniref:Homoserine kinase n=1 Tax=Nibricoccus aquaticus TaxID=2576891 RepID=A0A290Q9T4_9BACT|nr:homoserine kinase [Nibricoccus aquaticus]ATC65284.1 homoserine kinase [Nibricoccus aquaticus]
MSQLSLPDSVTLRVPGSTSNCGAGFDTLGLALQIYNRVTLKRAGSGSEITASREEDARGQKMVETTAKAFFAAAEVERFGFSFEVNGEVPPARGLGSSMTVIGGVLAGLNELSGARLSRHQLVEIANELEGHPDNASAAILGGFCVARCDPKTNRYLGVVRVPISDELVFVVASPSVEMLTKESRGVLPERLSYFDAVKSINSAAFFAAALATKDYAQLRYAVCDFMHEPYRLPRIPNGRMAIDAGIVAGALTGWLSGSGSSVLCLAMRGSEAAVGQAMRSAFAEVKIACEVRTLIADNDGLKVE